jgi:uncharacterized protein (DUF1501 family)
MRHEHTKRFSNAAADGVKQHGLAHSGMANPARRRLLGHGGASLASALGLSTAGALGLTSASAAADDYKALVCLFFFGGNDGLNMVTPRDTTRHAAYSAVRGPLALPRSSLVPLGLDYGLHPAMGALAPAWAEGALTALHNVGPLFAPLTKAQYLAAPAGDPLVPDSLFSHADQQLLWEAAASRVSERTGWGGRASAQMGTTNPVISFGGNGLFGLGEFTAPWALPGPGTGFGPEGFYNFPPVMARRLALGRMMAVRQKGPLAEAYATQQRSAFSLEARLAGLFDFNPDPAADPTGVTAAFAPLINGGGLNTELAGQLYQVARFVANRGQVLGTRQIFFVQLGRFDTHVDQIGGSPTDGPHAGLLKTAADSMAAFWRAIKTMGMQDRVTLFTQSDFGRTFAPNVTQGTDHAWGNQQLVLGGAVLGNTTYGRYPTLALGGPDDVGVEPWELQGRWLPSTSVDQYAATLLRWWGLSESQLDAALPNLANFGSARNLGFLRV